jgi:hypothetical protein
MPMYEVRATVDATMDFCVSAEDESEARSRVREYLKYVDKGSVHKQRIKIKTNRPDVFTHCFFMGVRIEDCNEY